MPRSLAIIIINLAQPNEWESSYFVENGTKSIVENVCLELVRAHYLPSNRWNVGIAAHTLSKDAYTLLTLNSVSGIFLCACNSWKRWKKCKYYSIQLFVLKILLLISEATRYNPYVWILLLFWQQMERKKKESISVSIRSVWEHASVNYSNKQRNELAW